MDWGAFYTELKGWQGAIGSLLGFTALIIGALFNFSLNRKRDRQIRLEEIIAIASALYGEIVLVRRSLAHMANAVGHRYFAHRMSSHGDEPYDIYFIAQFSLPQLKLYPALAPKIGMLPSQLALEIVQFYARVEEAQTWLTRMNSEERPFNYSITYVLDPAIDAVTDILPGLRSIEEIAGIHEQEGTPDIKKACDAQEFERTQDER